jgi:hypothetical protein
MQNTVYSNRAVRMLISNRLCTEQYNHNTIILPPNASDRWIERLQRKQFEGKNQSKHPLLQPYKTPKTDFFVF